MVTKIPRFDFEKFPQADATLTTQMKSVGEVMAIGRSFQESFQKALRGLEIGSDGLDDLNLEGSADNLEDLLTTRLSVPGAKRVWYLAEAFRHGMTLQHIHNICKIDPWFLAEFEDIIVTEGAIKGQQLKDISPADLRGWKQQGFSDRRLAHLLGTSEQEVRDFRFTHGVHPTFKRVDSCAAEFDTSTAYLYSSYDEECEAEPTKNKKIMVLGGGPNRIGQGIEFDYCCVHASMALREDGFETIMVNCNPETVSTDYDTSDRLYFEPLTLEDVIEIVRVENPFGVIVQYGGQTPLKLARGLKAAGANVIGTTPESIHQAEDREFFQKLLADLDLLQPPNRTASEADEALRLADEIGYPLVVRPSYVLGGRAMEIVHNPEDLEAYMTSALRVSFDSPVLLDRFLNDATEVDVDAVCDGEQVIIGGIMEHIEEAGVHSGDSACSLPPFSLTDKLQQELTRQTREMAMALNVVGLMNVQFAVKGDDIYVLEVNPRASRTVPFVSKATARPLAKIAARCMAGTTLKDQGVKPEWMPKYFSVKEAVFPFIKFPGVDTILGPEMKSTGEVMGIGASFAEAFDKASHGGGAKIPRSGKVFISVRKEDQDGAAEIAKELAELGFELFATDGTSKSIKAAGVAVTRVSKVKEARPHVVDRIKNNDFDLIFNTTSGKQSIKDSYTIRREALLHKATYFTTLAGARAAVEAIKSADTISINRLQTLHQNHQ